MSGWGSEGGRGRESQPLWLLKGPYRALARHCKWCRWLGFRAYGLFFDALWASFIFFIETEHHQCGRGQTGCFFVSFGQPGTPIRTAKPRFCLCRGITVPIVLCTLLSLLYPLKVTLALPSVAAEISLKGAWTDAFISRANKRQLTNKPLIESPSSSSLSVVHAAAVLLG